MSERPLLISDGVIRLSKPVLANAHTQLAGEDDEHARRFGWYPARSTLESVQRTILRWISDWQNSGSTLAFSGHEFATNIHVGGCELRLQENHTAEMSYWTFPDFRGMGYGTRVANLATTFAFNSLNIQRIDIFIEPDNMASLSVARKAGFSEIGRTLAPIGENTDPVEVIHFTKQLTVC